MSSRSTSILQQNTYIGIFGPDMAPKNQPDSWKAVGQRIDLIRRAMGWENQFIAKMIGCSPQQWRNYKMGANEFPSDYAVKLCLVTGVTMDYIYRNEMRLLPDLILEQIAADAEAPAKPARRA